jgi:hypothetical protein
VVSAGARVAVVGGDGRQRERWQGDDRVVFFMAPRDGGNGELRRLEAALRAGSIDRVVILARWNGHAATRRVRRLCRARAVPVEVRP